ncbi:hypothetical protein IT411_02940 [Candidatus Peregrinibacteria bacterium]|nr:hypothetical protein [Candidatus Peregrinibacteria bacterium]
MENLNLNSPFTLERFQWLMENAAVASYLADESLAEIQTALSKGDESVLKQIYPIILEQFVSERQININFVLQEEALMSDVIEKVEKAGFEVKTKIKERTAKIEEKEKLEAENILKKL